AGHHEVARARLYPGTGADVADDDAEHGPIETCPARQQSAAIEEAGARQITDPQLRLVHPDKF
ncbi:MAG: hypothetical protein QOE98_343, partial [Gaiellaceae bacterium]|nr:hypothetical protein [Gaiellaceae bacterium]